MSTTNNNAKQPNAEKKEFESRIRNLTIEHLSLNKAERNAVLLDYLISKENLTKKELADNSPNGKKNQLRSQIGTILASMVKDKTLSNDNGFFTLIKEKPIAIKEEEVKPKILALFDGEKTFTKKEIFSQLEWSFKTNLTETKTDDINLHNIAGRLIKQFTDDKRLEYKDGHYFLPAKKQKTTYTETEIKEKFIAKLLELGGEFLERFTANLFNKYFQQIGYKIEKCEVTGGANDNGIDCVIETFDKLNFKEKIFFQVKCFGKTQVTEKDVREFCGAVLIKEGSHGIYVTTSTYHSRALKILQNLDNFTYFDKESLFNLAKTYEHGIKKVKNGYVLDTATLS